MSDASLKAEARLVILEHFVCSLYANGFLQTSDPMTAVKEFAGRAEKWAEGKTIPGADPVVSDMLSDEIGFAAKRLADQVVETVEAALG